MSAGMGSLYAYLSRLCPVSACTAEPLSCQMAGMLLLDYS